MTEIIRDVVTQVIRKALKARQDIIRKFGIKTGHKGPIRNTRRRLARLTDPVMNRTLSALRDPRRCVLVDGNTMFLDPHDSLLLSVFGAYEPLETGLIKDTVKEGDVVVDIGANIGYYTLLFAKIVGPTGIVFSFEPDPANFALLKKNVECNGYKNVVLIMKGVTDVSDIGRLYIDPENAGGHSLYEQRQGLHSMNVETTKLDDFFRGCQRKISLIKMDIEGAEMSALRGAREVLTANGRLRLISEFNPRKLTSGGTDPLSFIDYLQELGFQVFDINETSGQVEAIDDKTRFIDSHRMSYTNIFCIFNKGS